MGAAHYMQMGVKPLIEASPEIGQILERYGIACVQCTIGTCKMEDVVKFHALPPQDRAEMMSQIEGVIYAGTGVPQPQIEMPLEPPRPAQFSYSLPVGRLVNEHGWIKRVLALIPDVVDEIRTPDDIDSHLLRAMVDFIRGYADRFHHIKEEDILFDYTDRKAEIVQVILQDHDQARGLVGEIARAIEDGNRDTLCLNLTSYRALLTEHITKEDEVLYPYIDRGLTTSQVGEIFRRFEEAEDELEDDVPQRYERFVTSLAGRFHE